MKSCLSKEIDCDSIVFCSLPSYGNIGQMALDCLISTLSGRNQIERLGHCLSRHVLPMTGYDQFSPRQEKVLCLPIEVYQVIGTKFVFIQQRSPCIPSHLESFVEEYFQFLENLQCRHIFFLCGSTTCGLSDEILQSHRFFHYRTYPVDEFPELSKEIKNAKVALCDWPPVFSESIPSFEIDFEREDAVPSAKEDILDGSPIVSALIQKIVDQEKQYKYTVLGRFCNEGNNLGDAVDLVVLLVKSFQFFETNPERFEFPASWSCLFGPPIDEHSIF